MPWALWMVIAHACISGICTRTLAPTPTVSNLNSSANIGKALVFCVPPFT